MVLMSNEKYIEVYERNYKEACAGYDNMLTIFIKTKDRPSWMFDDLKELSKYLTESRNYLNGLIKQTNGEMNEK